MKRSALCLGCAVALLAVLAACRSNTPMEDAGEAVDEAASDVGDLFD